VKLHPPSPPLSDGTVTLRELSPADAPAVATACRDPEIVRWTTEIPESYTEAHARDWIASTRTGWAKGAGQLAVTETETGAFAGAIGLFVREQWIAEIGYWVAAPFRGRGFATAALVLVADWAHSLGFVRVQLMIFPGNDASARVASKCGFVEEGVLRDYANQRGVVKDVSVWSRVGGKARPGGRV
jgi:RimJ/RimL family protein N-acetyltransferase